MSFSTWTPHAVSSNEFTWSGLAWRMVEAQHYASTMKIVDTRDEQDLLEFVLEKSKPTLSSEFQGLHYLLATPFRYQPSKSGSRFRGVNDPSVFYCAESSLTAGIELGYWRWRFLNDSEGIDQIEPVAHTAFSVELSSKVIDLRTKPFSKDRLSWTQSTDYRATQELASIVRKTDVSIIFYESVRNPESSWCAAVLKPDAFKKPKPIGQMQTWLMKVSKSHLILRSDSESAQISTENW